MTVALFIYREIYCRYLSPGECVIHDRGTELANEVVQTMLKSFGVDVLMVSAGRPQANGQAEVNVRTLKEKLKALMSRHSTEVPQDWDETLLYAALSIMRSDPAVAHGYAPASLLLGRGLVYPVELQDDIIDFSGTEFTKTNVEALFDIHDLNFGVAAEKVKEYQKKYKKDYDKRHKVQKFKLRKGAAVQVKRSNHEKARKMSLRWKPRCGWYVITKVHRERNSVSLKNPKTGKTFKKKYNYDQIRKYRGPM